MRTKEVDAEKAAVLKRSREVDAEKASVDKRSREVAAEKATVDERAKAREAKEAILEQRVSTVADTESALLQCNRELQTAASNLAYANAEFKRQNGYVLLLNHSLSESCKLRYILFYLIYCTKSLRLNVCCTDAGHQSLPFNYSTLPVMTAPIAVGAGASAVLLLLACMLRSIGLSFAIA
jgi:hypothetical protein